MSFHVFSPLFYFTHIPYLALSSKVGFPLVRVRDEVSSDSDYCLRSRVLFGIAEFPEFHVYWVPLPNYIIQSFYIHMDVTVLHYYYYSVLLIIHLNYA